MNKRRKAELRAGLFVNLGAGLLMLALFFFGSRLTFFWKPLHYSFQLDNAQGLTTGSKVYVAGIDAGTVGHVALDFQRSKVRVEIDLMPEYQEALRQDSHVELATQGVLGDRVVMISQGNSAKPEIRPGGEIPVRETLSLNQIVKNGDAVIRDFDQLILNLDRFATKLNSDLSLKKANDAFNKLDKVLGKLDNGQGTLGALINDPSLYDDAKALIGEANSNRIVRNIVRKSIADAKKTG